MIHYIGYYISSKQEDIYKGNIPGMLKMRYIEETISKCFKLSIYSLAYSKKSLFLKSNTTTTDLGTPIIYRPSIKNSNKLLIKLDLFLTKLSLKRYIKNRVNKNDVVIVYHSLLSSYIVSKFKKCKIINEVEEIYGYGPTGRSLKVQEEINVLKKFDAYILINENLIKTLALNDNSLYCIAYGAYKNNFRYMHRFDDGKIHVVYAGTIENKKKGAIMAVKVAEFLPENYVVDILGFGNDEAIDNLLNTINKVNSIHGEDRVKYHGYKKGKDLDDFLFSCHIGLSTYVMDDDFSMNSFPSKVLTYLSHDLIVVKGLSKGVENLDISKYIKYYNEYTPQSIAQACLEVKIPREGEYNCIIKNYDILFTEKINSIIRKIGYEEN